MTSERVAALQAAAEQALAEMRGPDVQIAGYNYAPKIVAYPGAEKLAQFIALANPSTILALLAERETLRKALQAVTDTYESYRQRGVIPAPAEYSDLVAAIGRAKSALTPEHP